MKHINIVQKGLTSGANKGNINTNVGGREEIAVFTEQVSDRWLCNDSSGGCLGPVYCLLLTGWPQGAAAREVKTMGP